MSGMDESFLAMTSIVLAFCGGDDVPALLRYPARCLLHRQSINGLTCYVRYGRIISCHDKCCARFVLALFGGYKGMRCLPSLATLQAA